MSEQQTQNIEIALWLGYRQHQAYIRNWFLPEAPEDAPASETIALPDFYNSPVHYERIKAKLRESHYDYDLGHRQPKHTNWPGNHRLHWWVEGSRNCKVYHGPTEGDVLVQCALDLIYRGL